MAWCLRFLKYCWQKEVRKSVYPYLFYFDLLCYSNHTLNAWIMLTYIKLYYHTLYYHFGSFLFCKKHSFRLSQLVRVWIKLRFSPPSSLLDHVAPLQSLSLPLSPLILVESAATAPPAILYTFCCTHTHMRRRYTCSIYHTPETDTHMLKGR